MNHDPPSVHDRDLDIPLADRPVLPADAVGDYQRLVMNPLLMILSGLLAAALIQNSLRTRNVWLFLSATGLFIVSLPLFQFHCLDCGATGWYHHARRHVCDAVLLRYRRGSGPASSWSARTQMHLWVYIITAGLIGVGLVALARF